jgi:hypothetical protein
MTGEWIWSTGRMISDKEKPLTQINLSHCDFDHYNMDETKRNKLCVKTNSLVDKF